MKIVKGLMVVIALVAGGTVWFGCEDQGEENEGGPTHNAGNNCMVCHKAGGQGEGIFTAAGTVYKVGTSTGVNGATIKLYANADASGTPLATMTSNESGNFYTKSSIDFGTGLYVKVTTANGTTSMGSSITQGACNGCHGVVTDKITVQ